jgi:hypothetical protein
MKRTIIFILLLVLVAVGCRKHQRMGSIQGDWYKKGFDIKAFTVKGDSMYFPGLENGYPYDLQGDILIVHFAKRSTKSLIIYMSSYNMTVWDLSLSGDTVNLQREPSSILDVSED